MTYICTALRAEARPLIDHFKLKAISPSHPFPLYENAKYRLIITGVSKVNAALAIGYWQGVFKKDPYPIFLNVGIAGDKNADLNQGFLAHCVQDRSWQYFPIWIPNTTHPKRKLITVDQISNDYPEDAMIDQEGSGFAHAASYFSIPELTHLYKIISDNKMHAPSKVTETTLKEQIRSHQGTIEDILEHLSYLKKELKTRAHPKTEAILNSMHFTSTETHQVKELLRRCHLLDIDVKTNEYKNAKECIHYLRGLF